MAELLAWPADFIDRSPAVAWTMVGVSVASLLLVALLLPRMVARLPADYFSSSRRQSPRRATAFGWTSLIAKNLLGVVFVLGGAAMLFLPGQGLLTILIGVFLVDFPGKRALECAVVRREGIRRILNRMRVKRGQPPLEID